MQQNGLTCEDWGGETAAIKVSAKTGEGIENLLERILLEAEMLELKADPKRAGFAYVLESQLEQGFGPTAHIIVKNGCIKLGDPILCGEYYGKVKNLIDVHGQRIKSAGPATPVKIADIAISASLIGFLFITDIKVAFLSCGRVKLSRPQLYM